MEKALGNVSHGPKVFHHDLTVRDCSSGCYFDKGDELQNLERID